MGELLEAGMVICFGISWPASIYKSYKSRTAKGKSLLFLILIIIGYIFGILSKIINNNITYVLFFYVLNSFMVLADIALYFKNKKLDISKKAPSGIVEKNSEDT